MSKNDKYAFVLFDSTVDAINFESEMKESSFIGRLVPVPSSLSANCGMAWMEKEKNSEKLNDYINNNSLTYSRVVIIEY